VIATQAIEAGVDISSRVMFTELAPWSSMVQRFGRCNRAGEYGEARVYWLDIASIEKLAAPYTDQELDHARKILLDCDSVAAADLPPVESALPLYQVMRRKDFLDLFNTDPDLSGFDIDISPWIRDGGTPPVWVYWRDFGDQPGGQGAPARDELCPVSISQIKDHLKKLEKKQGRAAFVWNALAQQWSALSADEVRPGMTLLLRCADGGYDPATGFIAGHLDKKQPLSALDVITEWQASYDDDRRSQIGRAVTLTQHLADVRNEAERLCEAVGETGYRNCVSRAAQWHDTGKAHRAFQTMLLYNDERAADKEGQLWAKGEATGESRYAVCGGPGGFTERRHFRHELASMLAWLEHGERDKYHDLIAYLIAAHHGKVRMGLRALPDEQGPGDARRFARGVWEDDTLPALEVDGVQLPETALRLDLMELGDGAMGPSW
ncbi:MAG TPA: CRISPR-associated endonuclease Cas3'', partial [Chromatiales bacterium]|nr:CRISPR-associated endonuclease Cas3'' [Chromatiales bacterium]